MVRWAVPATLWAMEATSCHCLDARSVKRFTRLVLYKRQFPAERAYGGPVPASPGVRSAPPGRGIDPAKRILSGDLNDAKYPEITLFSALDAA